MTTPEILKALGEIIIRWFSLKKAGDAFTDQVDIIYAIDKLIHDKAYQHLNIERSVIVKAHNDGEELNPLSFKYMSVVYEDFRDPFVSIREKYRAVPIDREYTLMISEMYMKKGIVISNIEALPESMMKNILKTEGVKTSHLYFLKHTKKAFWYLAIGTSKEEERFNTPQHLNELYLLVGKIRRLLKQY